MDPETIDSRPVLDEAFENIIILGSLAPPDDDWMAGEFDIT
jgi:uncharacterized membrane protein